MTSRSVMQSSRRECVGDRVISDLVRECGVEVNVLHARIGPGEEGRMPAGLRGPGEVLDGEVEFPAARGVEVEYTGSGFIWRESRCVHCGACAGICPSGAFSLNPVTFSVIFDISGCIHCGLCIEACYYGAVQSVAGGTGCGGDPI